MHQLIFFNFYFKVDASVSKLLDKNISGTDAAFLCTSEDAIKAAARYNPTSGLNKSLN